MGWKYNFVSKIWGACVYIYILQYIYMSVLHVVVAHGSCECMDIFFWDMTGSYILGAYKWGTSV